MFEKLKQSLNKSSEQFRAKMAINVYNCKECLNVEHCQDCKDYSFCAIKKFEVKP